MLLKCKSRHKNPKLVFSTGIFVSFVDPHRFLYNFWDEDLFLGGASLKNSWKIARTLRRQSEFVEIFELKTFFYLWKFLNRRPFFWPSPCSFDLHWNKFLVPPCPFRFHINKLLVAPKIYFCPPPPVMLSWRRVWRLGEVLEIGSLRRNRESWQVYLLILYCVFYKFIWTWNS